ncbi:hypothetical protein ACFQVB_34295 [Paraburkholderia humisilvae]|uniref:hypothetical protein n=1 Tax=Paraburkholderia humisilvae TaxID=627669 RepID=UPI00360790E2
MSTPDFFRSRPDSMIDLSHSLAVLANRMPWASIKATLVPVFEQRAREGRSSEALDLFGGRGHERGWASPAADPPDGRAALSEEGSRVSSQKRGPRR